MNKILHILLSFFFTRDIFSYTKILELHSDEKTKISGTLLQKAPFLYLLPYDNHVRSIIWSLKFKNNKDVAELLGLLLYETFPDYLIDWQQFENFTDPILVTVPSSKQTLRKRGYDQNQLIIESFLKQGGDQFITYTPKVIKKIKPIPKQSRTKTKQERLKNPKGAFAVANVHLSLIKDRNVILFDDILTTGATTNEIKKLLLKAGVFRIKIVAVAH